MIHDPQYHFATAFEYKCCVAISEYDTALILATKAGQVLQYLLPVHSLEDGLVPILSRLELLSQTLFVFGHQPAIAFGAALAIAAIPGAACTASCICCAFARSSRICCT